MAALHDLPVLVLDCQAGGATPAYGDLLELGWAITSSAGGLIVPVRSHWITPRTARAIPRAVRELTGWSKDCLAEALPEAEAWRALRNDLESVLRDDPTSARRDESNGAASGDQAAVLGANVRVPTVIHFARFELPFLRDLSERLDDGAAFPFDTVDLHAVATRLYPDLPRRNIRALAGFLGHSPELLRRAAGHVEATAFIWRALVPVLREAGIETWDALVSWLSERHSVPKRKGRVYPLEAERRRSLPDRPGVYRFVRRHGDIIYVGKAASLKKRVASHFARGARTTERNLEMLTQVHDIVATETASILEAALLETDEIKRIDPPYNVQLRTGERSAWFASRDLIEATPLPDALHQVGPLPSERAVTPLAALIALADGAEQTPVLLAQALAVATRELPDQTLFELGFQAFSSDLLSGEGPGGRRVQRAAKALWLARGRKEVEVEGDELKPLWDLARVRRRLERNLIQSGLLQRRARWLCLLADADVAFREPDMPSARLLRVAACEVVEREDLPSVGALALASPRVPSSRAARQRSFAAASYDRLRVLATELRRVLDAGGEVALRIGKHQVEGERLLQMMSAVY